MLKLKRWSNSDNNCLRRSIFKVVMSQLWCHKSRDCPLATFLQAPNSNQPPISFSFRDIWPQSCRQTNKQNSTSADNKAQTIFVHFCGKPVLFCSPHLVQMWQQRILICCVTLLWCNHEVMLPLLKFSNNIFWTWHIKCNSVAMQHIVTAVVSMNDWLSLSLSVFLSVYQMWFLCQNEASRNHEIFTSG